MNILWKGIEMRTIQELIDDALAPKLKQRSGKWSPSSFGRCYRQQYWNRKDALKSNPPDTRTYRVFKAGRLFHDFVQGLLDGVETEVKVECEDVLGYADIVRDNEVVDLKSQHSKSFWWMKKKNADIRKEKYGNWLQLMYYVRELNKTFGRLVFISKDDLCIMEYVECINDWTDELDNELTALRYLWKKQELPPALPRCEPNAKGEYWECNYCDFKDKCKELEDEHTKS